jgi:ABC-type proline/glycine betaine transport system permease subunit
MIPGRMIVKLALLVGACGLGAYLMRGFNRRCRAKTLECGRKMLGA